MMNVARCAYGGSKARASDDGGWRWPGWSRPDAPGLAVGAARRRPGAV